MTPKPKRDARVEIAAEKVLQSVNLHYDEIAPIYAMNKNSDLFLVGSSGKGKYLTVGELRLLATAALKPQGKGKKA